VGNQRWAIKGGNTWWAISGAHEAIRDARMPEKPISLPKEPLQVSLFIKAANLRTI
jgi:hypothetical protein